MEENVPYQLLVTYSAGPFKVDDTPQAFTYKKGAH